LLWQLRSPAIARKIAEINVRAAQANLSLEQVRNFEIPLVSQAEQRAIAAALDDIEDLTANLERMIAKKQAIKQGMMQQLLTGRTRLPGFTEPWREVRLGDVLAVRHGRSQKAVESPAGQYPILATGGQIGWATSPLYSKPSVLIGRKGTIDRPQYQETPFWTVDTLFYTEISTSADPRYMYYLFTTVDWQSMNEASGVPSLSSSRVEGVDVQLPGVDEQRAIRSMLDDADAEATALEVRLKKTQAIKQGMMQQLLTGRTRLPVKEDAA
jgi:type I restriction enzyme S subunit